MIAALIVAAIVSLISFFVSRGLWRAIRRSWRAATIRKVSNESFVIVRCLITNDARNAIANEIDGRLEMAFRAFAGWPDSSKRPFRVMEFPLALPEVVGSSAHDRALRLAKHWLQKTNGDILIWGSHVRRKSVGIIRLVGQDPKTGIIEVRRIDFDSDLKDFDDALANAVAFEAARLTQVALSEPQAASVDELRALASRLNKLSSAIAPALNDGWRRRMEREYWRVSSEIMRQTSSLEEQNRLELEARKALEVAESEAGSVVHSAAAVTLAIFLRKKNWSDRNKAELAEARALLDEAVFNFEKLEYFSEAADAAIERSQIKRLQLAFLSRGNAQRDEDYRQVIRETRRLIDLSKNEDQQKRLIAVLASYPELEEVAEFRRCYDDEPESTLMFVERLAGYLDNCELLDLVTNLASNLHRYGDRKFDRRYYSAVFSLTREILRAREKSWTREERNYAKAHLGSYAEFAFWRVRTRNDLESRSYGDTCERIYLELNREFSWRERERFTYIELQTLLSYARLMAWKETNESYQNAVEALRICSGPLVSEFPSLQAEATVILLATLNNTAAKFNEFRAAQEAVVLSARVSKWEAEDPAFMEYICAFAAWQFARLTPVEDIVIRAERTQSAYSLAEEGLKRALASKEQFVVYCVNQLLKNMEGSLPRERH